MAQKKDIETEIDTHASILKTNNCTMRTPLVDEDGFPRADIDIFAVRGARVRIIELRNDLEAITNEIGKALEAVYDPTMTAESNGTESTSTDIPKAFARVDGVAPGSPAAEAGLRREDLVVKFGHLIHTSFTSTSLQPLAEVVAANENQSISIKVLRDGNPVFLSFVPRKGWGGRGMLGCHIVPLSPS
ncbi:putative 26S proteasome regulatory subunit [Marasmius crinis-equi]|uniref:26S proteasome regulatory subunit n=1 Tax=Marasmius crinis-equi TaxID=585013 RepID=A0ABR3ESI7_9AGAR